MGSNSRDRSSCFSGPRGWPEGPRSSEPLTCSRLTASTHQRTTTFHSAHKFCGSGGLRGRTGTVSSTHAAWCPTWDGPRGWGCRPGCWQTQSPDAVSLHRPGARGLGWADPEAETLTRRASGGLSGPAGSSLPGGLRALACPFYGVTQDSRAEAVWPLRLHLSPDRRDSGGQASSHRAKGRQFDSRSGHTPGLWFGPGWGAYGSS